MAISRNKIQELIVIGFYQILFYKLEEIDINEIAINLFNDEEKEEEIIPDQYLIDVLNKSLEKQKESIETLEKYLKNWQYNRLNLIEQSILSVFLVQYKYFELPRPVAINIAVSLTKKYCDEKSYKFINAVLEKALV